MAGAARAGDPHPGTARDRNADALWTEAETESKGGTRDALDSLTPYILSTIGAGAATLLIGLVLMRVALSRRKDLTADRDAKKRLSEEEFEAKILKEMGMGGGTGTGEEHRVSSPSHSSREPGESDKSDGSDRSEGADRSDGADRSEEIEGAGRYSGGAAESPGQETLAASVRAVVERMRIGNFLADDEPPMTAGPEIPGACLLRLRSGKRALVVASDVPLDRLVALQRWADYLILARDADSALVCRSLSDFIADEVFPG